MAEQRPVLGIGWGRFTEVSPEYYKQAPDYPVTSVANLHNVPLSLLVELGAIGLFGWAACVVAAAHAALRRGPPEWLLWRMVTFAVFASWLILLNFTPLRYAFANYLVWTMLGLSAGLARRGERTSNAGPHRSLRCGGLTPGGDRSVYGRRDEARLPRGAPVRGTAADVDTTAPDRVVIWTPTRRPRSDGSTRRRT